MRSLAVNFRKACFTVPSSWRESSATIWRAIALPFFLTVSVSSVTLWMESRLEFAGRAYTEELGSMAGWMRKDILQVTLSYLIELFKVWTLCLWNLSVVLGKAQATEVYVFNNLLHHSIVRIKGVWVMIIQFFYITLIRIQRFIQIVNYEIGNSEKFLP